MSGFSPCQGDPAEKAAARTRRFDCHAGNVSGKYANNEKTDP
jgi:hypothetical protein